MVSEALTNGTGNQTVWNSSVAYINQRVYVDRFRQRPGTDYTYVGTLLTFLPSAFPDSPTPGAPPLNALIDIEGDTSVLSTVATATGRDYTSTELIASVQQRAFIPLSARDFGSAQILRLFNEEIDGYLVPFVAQRRLEFWVESLDTAFTNGIAAIPSVAMGGKLRAIAYLQGGVPFGLDQIDLPVAVAAPLAPLTVQYPSKYYFMGNNVILWPTPSSAGTLRLYYYRRPSMLVLPSQCIQITGFPAGAPANFFRVGFSGGLPSSYAVNVPCDLVGNVPNFTLYSASQAIHATDSATYIELPGSAPTGLAVGDWLSLAGTAPVIVGAPADLTNLLVQEIALKVTEAKGTEEAVKRLAAGLAKAESGAGWTIKQRNEGAMRKVSAFPSDGLGYPWGGY